MHMKRSFAMGNLNACLSACATDLGEAYTWGSNTHGQCGNGVSSITEYDPVQVQGMEGETVVQLALGFQYSLAVTGTCCVAHLHN